MNLKSVQDSANVECKKAVHLPLRPEKPDCSNKSCPFMWRCKFNHPISRTRSQVPNFRVEGAWKTGELGLMGYYSLDSEDTKLKNLEDPAKIKGRKTVQFPQRPEMPDFSNRSRPLMWRCKFNHPISRTGNQGERVCGSYWSFGLCIHGASCKYDHSVSDGCPSHPSSRPVPPIATSSSITPGKSK